MENLATFAQLFAYNDDANRLLLAQAGRLSPAQLDQALDLGLGSIRKILQHILHGEATWLARSGGEVEVAWPACPTPAAPADIERELAQVSARRKQFLAGLSADQLDRVQKYRDSKGAFFQATLRQMLLQMIVHSIHHRAQVVNGIRRVGGVPPELDLMYSLRQPV